MKEIKNLHTQERQKYVPASVKIITTSVQRVICASIPTGPGNFNGNDPWNPTY